MYISKYEVAHYWAHQLKKYARSGNMYFYGDTIYSYGDHFPMAKVITYKGKKAYVVNSDRYSNSTSKHQNIVSESIPCDALVFHVSGCRCPSIINNVAHNYGDAMSFVVDKLSEIWDLQGKQERARTRNYGWQITENIFELIGWVGFWHLDKPSRWDGKRKPSVQQFWQDSNFDKISKYTKGFAYAANCLCIYDELEGLGVFDGAPLNSRSLEALLRHSLSKESADKICASIKKAEARAKRKENKQKGEEVAKSEEYLAEWHNGTLRNWYVTEWFCIIKGWNTALRIADGCIETSKGIKLSFAEGKRLWGIIKHLELGGKFQRVLVIDMNENKWKFDEYKNHILFAGCHAIPFSECERIAKIMGWT